MWKNKNAEDWGINRLHSIHVTTSEEDVVVQWGIYDLNIDKNGLTGKFDGDIFI